MEQAKIEISTVKSKRVIDLLPEWEDREHNIFKHSSKSYFYLPFKEVNTDDIIEIDCEYIESVRVVQGYYYLNIPFTFYDRNPMTSMFAKNENENESKQNNNQMRFDPNRAQVTCRLFHSHSMGLAVTYELVLFLFIFCCCFVFCFFCKTFSIFLLACCDVVC